MTFNFYSKGGLLPRIHMDYSNVFWKELGISLNLHSCFGNWANFFLFFTSNWKAYTAVESRLLIFFSVFNSLHSSCTVCIDYVMYHMDNSTAHTEATIVDAVLATSHIAPLTSYTKDAEINAEVLTLHIKTATAHRVPVTANMEDATVHIAPATIHRGYDYPHRYCNSPHRGWNSPHSAFVACIEAVAANTVPVTACIEAVTAHMAPFIVSIAAAKAHTEVATAHVAASITHM